VRTFTFDNIDVLLGQHAGVSLNAIQDKFVGRGRGGYCFEHSTIFAAALERLDDVGELALMRRLALYPRLIEAAAGAHEPHRIAFYLYELASEFHALWTRGTALPHLRFIIENDPETTKARLSLIQGLVYVLASGLALLGVGAPDEMR